MAVLLPRPIDSYGDDDSNLNRRASNAQAGAALLRGMAFCRASRAQASRAQLESVKKPAEKEDTEHGKKAAKTG